MAGCGGSFSGAPRALEVALSAHTVRTGDQLRLSATARSGSEPAQVAWRVSGSDNAPALGSGSISSDGVYTPPGTLSRDLVTVSITAAVAGDPQTESANAAAENSAETLPVTTTISVVPGFAQPLQPENAALIPGASIQVRAQLAEVGAGSVSWALRSAASSTDEAASASASSVGSLGGQHCESSSRQFTTCSVNYTAPANALPGTLVWLIASTHSSAGLPASSVRARLLLGSLSSNPSLHQVEQTAPVLLGGSGGSDNDFDTYKDRAGKRFVADCCGGTLGAIVEDQAGTPYILSNNHVLASSDQGRPGDTIEQPGLIDNGCVPLSQAGSRLQPVGTLRYAVPLDARSSNVDAALASVNPGTVDSSGSILEIGKEEIGKEAGTELGASIGSPEASLRSAPPVAGTGETLDAARLEGLTVVKSGRTTGLTCSTVDAIDLRVSVDYYKDCAETQPYTTKTFTGQIGIGGDAFADSGDSGALVLDAANARAIGLLYATSTAGAASSSEESAERGLSLANPIGDVLSELGTEAGFPLTLRGTSTAHSVSCLEYGQQAARPAASTLSADERVRTSLAAEAAGSLRSARVLAVAAGTSADEPGKGSVLVYIDHAQPATAIPATIAGVRTVPVFSDPETITRGPASWPIAGVRSGIHLSAAAVASTRAAAERLASTLIKTNAIFGVGVAESLDSPGDPALLVLIDSDAPRLETALTLQGLAGATETESERLSGNDFPAVVMGLRVRYLTLHRMRVTQSKYVARGAGSSCRLSSAIEASGK